MSISTSHSPIIKDYKTNSYKETVNNIVTTETAKNLLKYTNNKKKFWGILV
jgi:hypothetical protein